jgi:hypothetical protein
MPVLPELNFADFISTQALSSAVLVGAGLAMNWRSLHIGGEHSGHVRRWGLLSIAVFAFAWVTGAIQNHNAVVAVNDATNRAEVSDSKLLAIQSGISKIEGLVMPTGKPTPDEVLAAAAAKILEQGQKISELEKREADRDIPKDAKAAIVAILRSAGPHTAEIGYDGNGDDAEQVRFAEKIRGLFIDAGWNPKALLVNN